MARRSSAATSAMAAARAAAAEDIATSQSKAAAAEIRSHASPRLAHTEIETLPHPAEKLAKVKPRATGARYDRKARMIIVTFTNGAVFSFPPALLRGFSLASAEQLADIQVLSDGSGLSWPQLDTEVSATRLLNKVFGIRRALSQFAGQMRSPAKAAAVRANGAKGGRPRKSASAK